MSDGIEILGYERDGRSFGCVKGVKKMSGKQLENGFFAGVRALGFYLNPFVSAMGLKRARWAGRVRRNSIMNDGEIEALLAYSLQISESCCSFKFSDDAVSGIEYLRSQIGLKAKALLAPLGKNEHCSSYLGCDLARRGYLYPNDVVAITEMVHKVGNELRTLSLKMLQK